jgi:hypothetical protein
MSPEHWDLFFSVPESSMANEKLAIRASIGGRFRERKLYNLAPIGVGVQFGVHNADVATAARALVTRVFYHKGADGAWERPHRPAYGEFVVKCGNARRALLSHCRHVSPITPDKFVEAYTGAKRRNYERAKASLEYAPLQEKDAYISAFVKAEKLNLTSKPDPDPRLIQPRSTRYNLRFGCYIKACEHVIYGAIDEIWGGPTVMKGLNANKRGAAIADAWRKYKNPVAVGLDAHRFDQHVSKAALMFEHSIYYALFGHDGFL